MKRLYYLLGAVVAIWLMAVPAFAVGTSQVSLQALVDDITATFTANVTIVLTVVSVLIGVPLMLRLAKRIMR